METNVAPRWNYVVLFTSSGACLLAGAYFGSPYQQALLIGLGSTLALFSLLTIAAPYVIQAIGASMRISTLADAQAALRAEFRREAWRRSGSSDEDLEKTIQGCLRRIAEQICAADFVQCDSKSPGMLLFKDPSGMDIKWTVIWEDRRLRHVIESAVQYRLPRLGPVELPQELDAISTRSRLLEFEEHVYTLMRDLAIAVSSSRGQSGAR